MPRYLLGSEDLKLLISYLKTVSAEYSPGVTDTSLRFATVITDDVSPEDRKAMLDPLQNFVGIKNGQVKFFKTPAGSRSRLMAENMMPSRELALRTLSLTPWVLKGKPDTWRSQLEEYYRKEPVFALIGGITTSEWRPIHQFCEENRIPCLFPATDFPVISQSDWYTLYLSKGYYQEGEGAARYLNRLDEKLSGKGIVQIVRDSREGKALASGFQDTWLESGHEAPVTITVKPGDDINEAVEQMLTRGKSAAVIIWDGAAVLPTLEILAKSENKPDMLLLSSSYLGKSFWTLKENVRDFTYLTYPYRLPQLTKEKVVSSSPSMAKKVFPAETGTIANQTYSIIEILSMALMNMSGNYYRDNFLDVIGMIMDQEVPLYERLSFGPGQRYASKGCYIVQLAKGEKREIIKKSDWVIY
jgi:ABC-type branched-subunit amino acid transport system substrate-binding protein